MAGGKAITIFRLQICTLSERDLFNQRYITNGVIGFAPEISGSGKSSIRPMGYLCSGQRFPVKDLILYPMCKNYTIYNGSLPKVIY